MIEVYYESIATETYVLWQQSVAELVTSLSFIISGFNDSNEHLHYWLEGYSGGSWHIITFSIMSFDGRIQDSGTFSALSFSQIRIRTEGLKAFKLGVFIRGTVV